MGRNAVTRQAIFSVILDRLGVCRRVRVCARRKRLHLYLCNFTMVRCLLFLYVRRKSHTRNTPLCRVFFYQTKRSTALFQRTDISYIKHTRTNDIKLTHARIHRHTASLNCHSSFLLRPINS